MKLDPTIARRSSAKWLPIPERPGWHWWSDDDPESQKMPVIMYVSLTQIPVGRLYAGGKPCSERGGLWKFIGQEQRPDLRSKE